MSHCYRCAKKLNKALWKVDYAIPYDKCQGKVCPDCGKIRKLGWYKEISTEDPKCFNPCVRCKKTTNHWIDKICSKCFIERERKRGCVCFYDQNYNKEKGYHNNINYYCPICEEVHPREALCEECFEKQTKRNEFKRTFFRIIFPSLVVGVIIGFFLGWLFFKKLWNIREKSKK